MEPDNNQQMQYTCELARKKLVCASSLLFNEA